MLPIEINIKLFSDIFIWKLFENIKYDYKIYSTGLKKMNYIEKI